MKRILISTLAAAAASTAVLGENITLYSDPATGQVYTQDGANRVKMGTFVDAKTLQKTQKSPTILNQNSPDFLLGKATLPNMKFTASDDPDIWIKFGVRVQGTFQNVQNHWATGDEGYWDFFLRRTRFETAIGLGKYLTFSMDIRNDNVNYSDQGEQSFKVGNAYLKISKPFGTSLVNFRLFRGKINVSRDETVSSASVVDYNRPQVADEAAQFISHNRRASNIMMYGNWREKIHYQVAVGDGVYSDTFADASGNDFNGTGFSQQDLFYGGKVILSPFDGWEEKKLTETYFGRGKHFEIGAAYWVSPHINFNDLSGAAHTVDHKLLNLEISGHYEGLFLQAEYFGFEGVTQDWATAKSGTSKGWYATGEYVFVDAAYLAPFFRYEQWNRWEGESGYDLTSTVGGIHWYLRGNTLKAGIEIQHDTYGKALSNKPENDTIYQVTTQLNF
jgi:hypothetical protein